MYNNFNNTQSTTAIRFVLTVNIRLVHATDAVNSTIILHATGAVIKIDDSSFQGRLTNVKRVGNALNVYVSREYLVTSI